MMIQGQLLEELYYHRRLSMTEVAQRLKTTHATVLYWLKKHGMPRRSWSESIYAKQNPGGHPFIIPAVLSVRQRELARAGFLLYWAEGAKSREATRLANLDPRMLQLFLKFLREVCGVSEARLRLSVRVYKQFSLRAAKAYWARTLRLPASRVFVYRHTDQRSRHVRQRSRYGLATLEFPSTTFKAWLDRSIETYVREQLNEMAAESRN
jgi:hypothetical protein